MLGNKSDMNVAVLQGLGLVVMIILGVGVLLTVLTWLEPGEPNEAAAPAVDREVVPAPGDLSPAPSAAA